MMQMGFSSNQASCHRMVFFVQFFVSIFLPLRYMCLIFSRSVQTGESSILCFTDLTPLCCKYFALTISCQTPCSFSSLHHHLHKKLIFIFMISLIHRPPFFLLLHITSQRMSLYFFFVLIPCQKKFFFVCPVFLLWS
jgi:hypothetical protein